MTKEAPIGVFDSGIGGLTVVRELTRLMPEENLIYFGDTARTPYGSRPPAQILDFMHEILRFFAAQQVKMAVFACNTMTALGLENARRFYPFPLVGMSTAVKTALKVSRNKHIGVIATQATIASGMHGKAIKVIDPTAVISPQACPKFVPLIEAGKLDGEEIERAAREYLTPLKEADIDTLILGCTHYPMINPVLSRILGPTVTLVDPAVETAKDARTMLVKRGRLAETGKGSVKFCFSADLDRVRRVAGMVLDSQGASFDLVNLEEYAISRQSS